MDKNVINFPGQGGISAKPDVSVMLDGLMFRFDQLATALETISRNVNELALDQRIMYQTLVDNGIITDDQLKDVAELELEMMNKVNELLKEADTPKDILTKANEVGVPLTRLPLHKIILHNKDLTYNEKLDICKEFSLESVEKVLIDHKEYFLANTEVSI